MKRDWTNPWTNPVGELLYPVLAFALRFVPRIYDSPPPAETGGFPEPVVGFEGEKWCVDCKQRTMHHTYYWRTDDEYTVECDHCGGVFVGEL